MRARLPPGMEAGRAHWAGAGGSCAQALTVHWAQHGSHGASTEQGGQGLPPQVGRASVGGTLCPGQSHLLNRAWLSETQVLSSFAFIECDCVQRMG